MSIPDQRRVNQVYCSYYDQSQFLNYRKRKMAQSRSSLSTLSLTSCNLPFNVPSHLNRYYSWHYSMDFLNLQWIFLWILRILKLLVNTILKNISLLSRPLPPFPLQSDHFKQSLHSALHSLLEGSQHFTVPSHAQVSFEALDQSLVSYFTSYIILAVT